MIRVCSILALFLFLSGCQLLSVSGELNDAKRLAALGLNKYDDEWQVAWVNHAKEIYAQTTLACGAVRKTPGFIVHLGDSMTYASPNWLTRP